MYLGLERRRWLSGFFNALEGQNRPDIEGVSPFAPDTIASTADRKGEKTIRKQTCSGREPLAADQWVHESEFRP
jgi:hypothetical protein